MAFVADYDHSKVEQLKEAIERKPRVRGDSMAALGARVAHLARSGGGVSRRDFERLIGRNDLLPINYLERGLLAARAVGRIDVRDPFGGGGSWGTGFLVGPRLMITNNHVIESIDDARRATIEFGYDRGANGEFHTSRRFRIDADSLFLFSGKSELDFTLVAIADTAVDGGAAIDQFGYLRLDPVQHKIEESEFVTIIQHPQGDEKYIAIRENKVVQIGEGGGLPDQFLWYKSDTAPGSSGAPVFNDGWQVVAVHHKGVPVRRDGENGAPEYRLVTGEWVTEEKAGALPDDMLSWIANEGVRTSRIVAAIRDSQKKAPHPLVQELLDDMDGVRPFIGRHRGGSVIAADVPTASDLFERRREPRRNVHPLDYYEGRKGYDPDFLGRTIPLPALTPQALRFGRVAPVQGDPGGELRYEHFSVVFNADRKMALLTAVNIDGKQSLKIGRDDQWYYDSRLPTEIQVGDELYGNEPAGNYFDRGHLVRRLDPVWGALETAKVANQDTFHWTNCSPQYWQFNQSEEWWQGLENFILTNTDQDDLLATVFTGPLFQDDDEAHRGIMIPQAFWKVIVVGDAAGKLYSSAYLVSQKRYAKNIPFEVLPVGQHNGFQVSVAKLEQLTGLSFGATVVTADVYTGGMEDHPIRGLADIQHPRRTGSRAPRPFGRFESFSAFLESYTRERLDEESKATVGLALEERRRRIERGRERDVVELESVVADYLGTERSGGDSHQHIIINVRDVLKNDPDVAGDIERVRSEAEPVFVSIRFGDRMGLRQPVPGVHEGLGLRFQGEWIPKERAYAHGGERMSVLHFTHHPLGFVCNGSRCWE
jgi:endonuclease G, mitochondrial